MKNTIQILLTGILILSGCTPSPPPNPTAQPTFESSLLLKETPIMPTPVPNLNLTLQEIIKKAQLDAAQRASLPPDQITVISAVSVTWSNSSLGCPQPDMLYAEVLTPGYLIVLAGNGTLYEYHAGINSDPFYCANPLPPVEGIPGNT